MPIDTGTYRRTLPLLVTAVAGLIVLGEFFLNVPEIRPVAGEVRNWAVIIFGFTVLFGVASLVLSHLQRMGRQISYAEKFFSAWLVVVFLIFFILGLALPKGLADAGYAMMYASIYAATSQAVFSLHGFWLTMAAYRAFVAKNFRTIVMMTAGILVLIGLAPWGEMIWPGFLTIQEWLNDIPLTAGFRGMTIAAALGILIGAIRTLLGQEKGYLGT